MLRDDLVIMIFGVPEIVQFVINRGWLLSLDTAPPPEKITPSRGGIRGWLLPA